MSLEVLDLEFNIVEHLFVNLIQMTQTISGYDIIGDIHGHADKLIQLLQNMGYRLRNHVWQHPERKVIFVGDYIDRGPAIKKTLFIIKRMVESGSAIAIMGNHEYNALAFHYHNPYGGHIRKHSHKNILQHYETIKQFQGYEEEWNNYLSWFANLPAFIEIDGIRVVHACWDDENVNYLKTIEWPLTREILLVAHKKGTDTWKAFDETLKGKEIRLPDGLGFEDKDGHIRKEARIRWWMNTSELRLEEYLFNTPATILHQAVPQEMQQRGYSPDSLPVFFGHYWLKPVKGPQLMASNVCCLDYSVAKGGILVAYRHAIGEKLSSDKFFWV